MRLFGYYAFHSVINQIRKLFKTWVLIFLLVCFAFGALIGLGAGFLSDLDSSDIPDEIPGQEETDEPPVEDQLPSDDPMTDEERQTLLQIVEAIALAVVLLVFVFEAIGADKSGSIVFLGADVNLLFPSPMRPQSVLLFRLTAQIGATLFASIYLLFQLPNVVLNLGVSAWVAVAIMFSWILTMIYGKLLHVLLYTVASTNPRFKSRLRPTVFAVLGVIAAAFVLYWKGQGDTPVYIAAFDFFNHPITRYIPVIGWLKGFCMYAIEGNVLGAILSFAALLIGGGLIAWGIWSIRADFYEDAMAKSMETAELQAATTEGRTVRAQRKKDRSEKLKRDGMKYGCGANVYFFKAMYNRFRFAHFHVLTKTSETYLVTGIGVAVLLRYVLNMPSLTIVALLMGAIAFFRSLGNPIAQDTQMDSFRLLPENSWMKMLWSLLGGCANCLLDLLPGMVVATILLGASSLEMLGWIAVILSVDFYSTNVGVFIDLSVPVAAGKPVKQIVQIMFIYFGLLPNVALLVIGGIFSVFPLMAALTAVFNTAIGLIFFAFSPLFLERGKG